MPTIVYVAIYRVYDDRDPNHWAIYLSNSKKGDVILQVNDDKGGVGYYVDTPLHNKEPQSSVRHKESFAVGQISCSDHEKAVAAILDTPVDNQSETWNCQSWVKEALNSLKEAELFKWTIL
ncbi:hypothetical protein C2857_003410 [Epichloe festucae Fl1]|uniref:Uncharacterized protein n=1 Tax=Epichloe festucae (strain Fl1) TaxID=877507 RepID=A0A7S9PWW7_EPIFF|nr:hypothetical protein C2857_003410 [Epichloe festucae Fl1]